MLLIKFTTTFTITSFSAVRLSAIISVSATKVLSAMRFEPSLRYSIPLLFMNQRKSVAVINNYVEQRMALIVIACCMLLYGSAHHLYQLSKLRNLLFSYSLIDGKAFN